MSSLITGTKIEPPQVGHDIKVVFLYGDGLEASTDMSRIAAEGLFRQLANALGYPLDEQPRKTE